ncbi:MAG: 50S ribosomal protein L17 [Nitrospirae bacterium]|nr:50S ribosomal protein L17 [Candidatus Manganitrophaceae bacterium]
MRHRKAGRPLGRNSAHRKALFRNLVTSFLRYERIETTEAKAKELRAIADQMITLGKRGDLHARRMAASYILDKDVVSTLFADVAPRFMSRQGGYTRLIKTRVRYGDGAPMVIVELTEAKKAEKSAKKETKGAKTTKATKEKKEKEAGAEEAASAKPAS